MSRCTDATVPDFGQQGGRLRAHAALTVGVRFRSSLSTDPVTAYPVAGLLNLPSLSPPGGWWQLWPAISSEPTQPPVVSSVQKAS